MVARRDDPATTPPRREGSEYHEALGRAIQALRAEQGLKRPELARLAGISYPYLSEIENGKKRPTSSAVVRIADGLGVAPSELMQRAELLLTTGSTFVESGTRTAPAAGRGSITWASNLSADPFDAGASLAQMPSIRERRRLLFKKVREREDSSRGERSLDERSVLEPFPLRGLPDEAAVSLAMSSAAAALEVEGSLVRPVESIETMVHGVEWEPIRVMVIDDHEVLRQGLVAALHRAGGFEVVAETGDGDEALELVADLVPDLVVTDLHHPGLSGEEAIRRISEVAPSVRVLVLSVTSDPDAVLDAIKAGAQGVINKAEPVQALVDAAGTVADGTAYLSASLASLVLADLARVAEPVASRLTPRETQILTLVAEGASNAEIGECFSVSTHAVRNHVQNILMKLQVNSKYELKRFASEHGFVRESDAAHG